MRTAALLAVLLAAILPAAQMDKPPITRTALAAIEKKIDARLGRYDLVLDDAPDIVAQRDEFR